MKKLHWSFAAIILTLSVALAETSWGRGFGGMHGGMRGGGMRGGGMRGGGMRGGMPGGMRGGGFGGARPGGNFGSANFGGSRPGGFSPSSGFGAAVNNRPNFGGAGRGPSRPGSPERFGAGGPGAAGLGERRFPGGAAGGFGGNQTRPAARGGLREVGAGGLERRPNRSQLNSFLGLPSDGGLHSVAGNQLGRDQLGRDQRGLSRHPDAELRRRGDYVRRDFRGRDYYSAAWYRRYPGAWYPAGWAYGNAWAAATWASMNGWLGYGNTEPAYYDYGNNVTYQDNSVYMNGQDMGTSDLYYQQAQDLASTGAEAQTTDDKQWMPLGVFAMTHDDQNKANLILQLAVNKEGIIRGNYTATMSNDTKPVNGSVDKKTQRAAWTIGDNKENVIETGIYNLTKDEAPALVHFGKDKTEQWLLVRVKQDEQQQGSPAP